MVLVLSSAMTVFGSTQTEETKEQKTDLNYMTVDSSYVEIPGTQTIVAGIGSEESKLEDVRLYLRKADSQEETEVLAQRIEGGNAVFEIPYTEAVQSGEYVAERLTYILDGEMGTCVMAELGMDVRYGVNTDVETSPAAVGVDEEELSGVVATDKEGNVTSDKTLGEAISQAAGVRTYGLGSPMLKAGKNLVLVLDPGHDKKHAGAGANGLREEEINLKIAQYCREELEKYAGVKVYMTRPDSGECPHPGTTSVECNRGRVVYADSVDADMYISFHINSSESTKPKGVEIYYPNKNYRPDLSADAKALAEKVIEQLVDLGLEKREVKVWNSQDGTQYPDGSLADYLLITKECKKRGIPSILIEHAFISNSEDAAFLSKEENLEKLGKADAEGIREYYALGESPIEITKINYHLGVTGITASVDYKSVEPVEFKWSSFNISTGVWEDITGWSAKDKIVWRPALNGYWLQVEARDAQGNTATHAVDLWVGQDYTQEYGKSLRQIREHVLEVKKGVKMAAQS